MGGIAALAKEAGHHVTGCDANTYPPMSALLKDLGIGITDGYDPAQIDEAPDCILVGNAMTRGNPIIETMLDRSIPYCSGPQWLAETVLRQRHVMAISGTHGKTTVSSMLAWILQDAGLDPGFLVGGIPVNFGNSARLGISKYFIVEADEYDTAFFDKRAKFVHYRPQTLVINNLEFDHADIYEDLDEILWQFHQLMRTVPGNGRVIINSDDPNVEKLLNKGCWTHVERFSSSANADWTGRFVDSRGGRISISSKNAENGESNWRMSGTHNLENAVAAVAAANSAGVTISRAVDALSRFAGVKRRMERTATVADIAIYDDFAHHPTAISRSIAGLKRLFPAKRIVVALEPRSNTMKMGVHWDSLAESLKNADLVFIYRPGDMDESFDQCLAPLGRCLTIVENYDELVRDMENKLLAGDHVIFMSNGGFGASRQKLTMVLQGR